LPLTDSPEPDRRASGCRARRSRKPTILDRRGGARRDSSRPQKSDRQFQRPGFADSYLEVSSVVTRRSSRQTRLLRLSTKRKEKTKREEKRDTRSREAVPLCLGNHAFWCCGLLLAVGGHRSPASAERKGRRARRIRRTSRAAAGRRPTTTSSQSRFVGESASRSGSAIPVRPGGVCRTGGLRLGTLTTRKHVEGWTIDHRNDILSLFTGVCDHEVRGRGASRRREHSSKDPLSDEFLAPSRRAKSSSTELGFASMELFQGGLRSIRLARTGEFRIRRIQHSTTFDIGEASEHNVQSRPGRDANDGHMPPGAVRATHLADIKPWYDFVSARVGTGLHQRLPAAHSFRTNQPASAVRHYEANRHSSGT